MDQSKNLENWLRLHASWNAKKTVAKTNIFTVPSLLLVGNRELPSLTEENDHVFVAVPDLAIQHNKGLTCLACKLQFDDLNNQQSHFKSELHRVNLKRSLRSQLPLSFEEFSSGKLQEGNEEADHIEENSESGSDDELVGVDEVDNDMEDQLADQSSYTDEEGSVTKQFNKGYGPVFVFRRNSYLSTTSALVWEFTISIAAFHSQSGMCQKNWSQQGIPWDMLREQLRRTKSKPLSCVFLLRSGRFAGAIYDREKVVVHKVLRRYTVRAKAGGGQSSHDNKGGKARSAGAMLRRYGEQALKEDIQAILTLWSSHLQCCGAIYVSAPKTMRSVFFEQGALSKEDPRITYIPFVIDKPTLQEASFVHTRCTSVVFAKNEVSANNDASSSAEQAVEEQLQWLRSASLVTDQLSPGEAKTETEDSLPNQALLQCEPSQTIIAACASGSAQSAFAVVKRVCADFGSRVEGGEEDGDSSAEEDHAAADATADRSIESNIGHWDLASVLNLPDSLAQLNTPLHIAATRGFHKVVSLLLTHGADPCRKDVRGRTPYFLASDKDTRDAFRRYRGRVGEDAHNWAAAGVAAALTEDLEKAQKIKEKEKKKRAALRKKEQKAQELNAALAAKEQLEKQKQLEAELALKRQEDAGKCGACSVSLYGIKSLDVYDRRCCSAKCVIALRRTLAAAAAMKRFEK